MINRKTEREFLADLFETNLVGSGLPLQVVYPYQTVQFAEDKVLTALIVTSGGSGRDLKKTGNNGATLYFDLHVFVLFEFQDDEGNAWTEQDAEDRLDLIEMEIAELLQTNSTSTKAYKHESRSQTGSVVLSGEEYRREVIPVGVFFPNG